MKAEVPFFLTNFDIDSFFHNHHTLRKVAPLDTGAPDVRAARAAATEGYFAALQGAESLTVPPNGIETATYSAGAAWPQAAAFSSSSCATYLFLFHGL